MKKGKLLVTCSRKINKLGVDRKILFVYNERANERKEGRNVIANNSIRNVIRDKGDIDEMIFAADGKEASQTPIHSDR